MRFEGKRRAGLAASPEKRALRRIFAAFEHSGVLRSGPGWLIASARSRVRRGPGILQIGAERIRALPKKDRALRPPLLPGRQLSRIHALEQPRSREAAR